MHQATRPTRQPTQNFEQYPANIQPPMVMPPNRSPEGFAQTFGVDFRIALLALVLDVMLFGGELVSFGALVIFSILAGGVFGFVTYKAQRAWYGDDHDNALIKGLVMGLLTAIPTPLPMFLYLPAGVVGAVKKLTGK
jgi:hypothetical protein